MKKSPSLFVDVGVGEIACGENGLLDCELRSGFGPSSPTKSSRLLDAFCIESFKGFKIVFCDRARLLDKLPSIVSAFLVTLATFGNMPLLDGGCFNDGGRDNGGLMGVDGDVAVDVVGGVVFLTSCFEGGALMLCPGPHKPEGLGRAVGVDDEV